MARRVRRKWLAFGLLLLVVLAVPPFLLVGRSSVEPVVVTTDLELAYPPSSFRDLVVHEDEWGVAATYTADVCPLAAEGILVRHAATGKIGGDPQIDVQLCRSMSAPLAWLTFSMSSAVDEATMEDLRDVIPFEAQRMETPALSADSSEVTCVWADPDGCRLAMYRARYGSHLLTVQFVGFGSAFVVSEEAFGSFIVDLDAQVASALRP